MPKAAELRAPNPPDQGGVYFEVHTPGVYRDLFGTLQAFDPLDHQMPLALSLPAKVGWGTEDGGQLAWCRAEGWALRVGGTDLGGTEGFGERADGISWGQSWS